MIQITVKRPKPPKSKMKIIGRVLHTYRKIGVVILELAAPIAVGDTIKFQCGDHTLVQEVTSLHKDHESVKSAKKGETVGVKIDFRVNKGAIAFSAS